MRDYRAFDQGRIVGQQVRHRAGLFTVGQLAPGRRRPVQRRWTKGGDDRGQILRRQGAQVGDLRLMPCRAQRLQRGATGIATGQGKNAQHRPRFQQRAAGSDGICDDRVCHWRTPTYFCHPRPAVPAQQRPPARWWLRRRGMAKGTVKWFNTSKGFGFIAPDDGGKDIFVHISAVEQSGMTGLADNQKIEFDMVEGRDGRKMASNLRKA